MDISIPKGQPPTSWGLRTYSIEYLWVASLADKKFTNKMMKVGKLLGVEKAVMVTGLRKSSVGKMMREMGNK